MAKIKIDETWDGKEHIIAGMKVKRPLKMVKMGKKKNYGPGDTFDGPEELVKGRPWLILQSKAEKTEEKPKRGRPKKENSNDDKGEEKIQS